MRMNAFAGAFSCMVALATIQGKAQQPFDLDTTFRAAMVASGGNYPLGVNSLLVLPDGDLILSGQLRFPWDPNWIAPRSGCRLNSDGTRDLDFASYPLMGGVVKAWNDRMYVRNGQGLRRLWLDGQLDALFDMAGAPYFSAGVGGDFHVFADGRVLITGSHDLQDSIHGYVGTYELVWFSNTGYLDTTAVHRNCDGEVIRIEEQPDGKFLSSCICTVYEGSSVGRLFRVEADGALDPSFQTDFVWGHAKDFTVLADGRVLASGFMRRNGETDTLHIVRLMPDGSMDPTFNSTLDVRDLQLNFLSDYISVFHTTLPDGRIVIHGNFDRVNGEVRRGIAMLDSNGYLLSDPFSGTGCGDYDDGTFPNSHSTISMAQDPIGNWYIYGSYAGYDDGTTNDPQQRFVSRLHGLNVGVEELDPEPLGSLTLQPNPASNWLACTYRVTSAGGNPQLLIRDMTGRIVDQLTASGPEGQVIWDARAVPAGAYQVELIDGNKVVAVQRAILQP
ncbi:MAG: hypothetical protein IPJ76_01400 [Flavobacteriales bacterium]|nr:MAG: hypothetical protein IPJ76_01400 [Flavobacteriales bacterium]